MQRKPIRTSGSFQVSFVTEDRQNKINENKKCSGRRFVCYMRNELLTRGSDGKTKKRTEKYLVWGVATRGHC